MLVISLKSVLRAHCMRQILSSFFFFRPPSEIFRILNHDTTNFVLLFCLIMKRQGRPCLASRKKFFQFSLYQTIQFYAIWSILIFKFFSLFYARYNLLQWGLSLLPKRKWVKIRNNSYINSFRIYHRTRIPERRGVTYRAKIEKNFGNKITIYLISALKIILIKIENLSFKNLVCE